MSSEEIEEIVRQTVAQKEALQPVEELPIDRIYFVTEEEIVKGMLLPQIDPKTGKIVSEGMPELIPLYSRLNSLTRIDKREARIRILSLKQILLFSDVVSLDEDNFNHRQVAFKKALETFFRNRINDSIDGWKFKNLMRKITVHEFYGERRGRRFF